MHLTRRTFLATLLASPALANDFPIVPDAGFDRWLARFRRRAADRGITERTLDAAFARAGFIPEVIAKDRSQFETTLTLEDYLAITASAERVHKGRAVLQRHGRLLSQIEATYAVEPHVIAAIWGIESFYGTKRGMVATIAALATLTYDGRRAAFFEAQLIAALKILQNGDVTPQDMRGGWAGAMGHTQFIPTTYAAYAVDFRGDGRRDIWSDDPTDALASAAHYLKKSGWSHGRPWGAEVQTAQDGTIRLATGTPLPNHGKATLVQPQKGGPRFILWPNAKVLSRYNAAQKYVIGLGHLSDRIKGGPPLATPFPPDQYGLSQRDRVEMQQRLTSLGYDCGSVDGVFGPITRAAIKAYQTARGLKVDGIPSQSLLLTLR